MNRRDFLKAIGAGLVALVAGRFTGKQRPRYINGTHAEMFFDAPEGECVKLEPLDMFAEMDAAIERQRNALTYEDLKRALDYMDGAEGGFVVPPEFREALYGRTFTLVLEPDYIVQTGDIELAVIA